ncbi:hypothetical protein SE86_03185 [Acidilobus sp. 7A]|nr:hypothetical protein SE86_03185 [Acidilobus sp. 7A]
MQDLGFKPPKGPAKEIKPLDLKVAWRMRRTYPTYVMTRARVTDAIELKASALRTEQGQELATKEDNDY